MKSQDNATRLKMLIHRSKNRGCKETGILLSKFAENRLNSLSEREIIEYEKIIDMDDHDIYQEISRENPSLDLLKQLVANHHSTLKKGE